MRSRRVRSLATAFVASTGAVLASACDASFHDLRPHSSLSSEVDDARPTALADGDGGVNEATVLRRGIFQGRTGHQGEGQIEIRQHQDGMLLLVFGDDFAASPVPGPVVVLSYRADLGLRLEPEQGDVDLGAPRALAGAQAYVLPEGTDDRDYVWIFCKPFGVEIARAELKDVP
ncbi:MAG: hypothetical protein IPK13_02655 [Deltaproteobacteria bacterium]|nr:hypothetical protein [Deltaproteobacteria bacterium]